MNGFGERVEKVRIKLPQFVLHHLFANLEEEQGYSFKERKESGKSKVRLI